MLRRDVIIDLPGAGVPGDQMSTAAAKKQRPKYLSLPAILFQIRLPLPGWVSILHRISGALLVFPFAAWLLYLLDASLRSEQGFAHIREYLGMPLAKLGLLVLIWAYCHHFCAGLRYLALDLNKGIGLRAARISSAVVIVASLALTAFFASKLW
jgi:succinate dehydrogenase cytochrome b subunit